MSKATGYSLWLVPERGTETYEVLDKLICDVASQYQTPIFAPHVTLLSGAEGNEQDIREKTQVLAEKLTPYEIKLGEVDSSATYFQILFSRIQETSAMMNANTVAQKVFGVDRGYYVPHLSLAYGDLSNEQVATLRQIIAQLNKLTGMHFRAQGVELWRTVGTVEEWCIVATFPFGKS